MKDLSQADWKTKITYYWRYTQGFCSGFATAFSQEIRSHKSKKLFWYLFAIASFTTCFYLVASVPFCQPPEGAKSPTGDILCYPVRRLNQAYMDNKPIQHQATTGIRG